MVGGHDGGEGVGKCIVFSEIEERRGWKRVGWWGEKTKIALMSSATWEVYIGGVQKIVFMNNCSN